MKGFLLLKPQLLFLGFSANIKSRTITHPTLSGRSTRNMNNYDYIIRPENPNDYTYIMELNVLAFENGENEASLVELIRESEHFVSGLSLVAAKNEGDNRTYTFQCHSPCY